MELHVAPLPPFSPLRLLRLQFLGDECVEVVAMHPGFTLAGCVAFVVLTGCVAFVVLGFERVKAAAVDWFEVAMAPEIAAALLE